MIVGILGPPAKIIVITSVDFYPPYSTAAGRAPVSGEECVTLLCKRVMRWMQAAVRLAAGHTAEFLGTI